jgi:hypothetical protein
MWADPAGVSQLILEAVRDRVCVSSQTTSDRDFQKAVEASHEQERQGATMRPHGTLT